VNRADGINEIEGKAGRVAASEPGMERVSNPPATPKHAKAGVSKASLKNLNSDDHFDRSFSFVAMKGKLQNQKKAKKTQLHS
jgi:hypothetical protein